MFDLQRFKDAQASRHAGFADAMRELRAGRKTSHWIWYVFPQLAGLGHSAMSARYGLTGPDETAAYLRDPVLVERLVAAAGAARDHLTGAGGRAAQIAELMGSRTDATKLASCMTLFGRVARDMSGGDPRPEVAALAAHAEAILAAAAAQGYPPCAFTEAQLANATLP